jgi:hypothetical protein
MKSTARIFVGVLALSIALGGGSCLYKYRSAECKKREAPWVARRERLELEAPVRLAVGTKKEAVLRFLEEHGMPYSFNKDEVYAHISWVGCSPSGCGSNDAFTAIRIPVDNEGTVTGKPMIGGHYTDCL